MNQQRTNIIRIHYCIVLSQFIKERSALFALKNVLLLHIGNSANTVIAFFTVTVLRMPMMKKILCVMNVISRKIKIFRMKYILKAQLLKSVTISVTLGV